MVDRAKKALAIVSIAAFLFFFGFLAFQSGAASQHHKNGSRLDGSAVYDLLQQLWEWTTHDAVAVYTLVLAISTILLWLVTARGVKIQAQDTRILQRAYVSVDPLGLDLMMDGAHLIGKVSIKNARNLPARNLGWSIRMLDSSNGEEETFSLHETKGSMS
jgi:hypothetical protein